MKLKSSKQNFKKFLKKVSIQFSYAFLLLLFSTMFTTSLLAQSNPNCNDAILDFSKAGYYWASGSLQNSYKVHDQHFEVQVKNSDQIVQHVQEKGAGLKIGTDPRSVKDKATILYNLSQSTSNVKFTISDLDYKKYGHKGSNQQEAVRIIGYCNGTKVFPKLRSLSGSVHISGNYAVATTDSKYGYDESIEVKFDDCISQIKIEYGTGPDSPVHNPSYGKIYIGRVGGILASTCNSTCENCKDTCSKSVLNFKDKGYKWHKNSSNGTYKVDNQSIHISIADNDHILKDTEEYGAALKIGIDPKTKDDAVEVRYKLDHTSDEVKFVIRDLDYKHYGYGSSNQQEKVCVIGYRKGTEVLPVIKSLDGSVHIKGNCAEARANSAHGHDESIEVCFNECIDEVLIVYGSGSKVPVHNPTYSKIYIGDDYGFLTKYCKNTCIDCELVVDTGPEKCICPGETVELTAEVTGENTCKGKNEEITYLWSNGETTPTIIVSEVGIYEVMVTDCNGCTATSIVEVITKPVVDLDINLTDDEFEICEGFSFSLRAVTEAENVVWSTGETTQTITVAPSETTTYTVTASSPDKCPAVESRTLNIINLDLGEFTISTCDFITNENVEITIQIIEEAINDPAYEQYFILVSQPGGNIVDYIQYTGNPADLIFSAPQTSDYSIHSYIVDSDFNATTQLDDLILNGGTLNDVYLPTIGQSLCAELDFEGTMNIFELFNCARLDKAKTKHYEIYPNPAANKLNFRNINLENLVSINLTNIEGQIIKEIPLNASTNNLVVNINDVPSGIYLLNVQTALSTSTTKITVD